MRPPDLSSLTSLPPARDTIPPGLDLDRILALPERVDLSAADVDAVSRAYRKHPGVSLRPLQAASLIELADYGGLFAPIEVGGGKTLITFLASVVCEAQRPVMVVPSGMFRQTHKTQREFAEYHQDWHVRLPKLLSYQELSLRQHEHTLLEARPDLLILDEADMARNPRAAVTWRINQCVEWIRPRVAVLSGTLITDHLLEYYHLLMWALGERAPAPLRGDTAERWALALDQDVGTQNKIDPGALATIPNGFHSHLRTRRGVVPTPGDSLGLEIQITTWRPELPPELRAVLDYTTATHARPDGELLGDLEISRCQSELALGFFSIWDPMPPDWWLHPRRAWHAYTRAVLDEGLPGYQTEAQLVAGLQREPRPQVGEWADWLTEEQLAVLHRSSHPPPAAAEGAVLLDAWRAVEQAFVPHPRPVWITDAPIRAAVDRAGPRDTLIWSRFRAVGEKFAELGVPHYGADSDPQKADPGRTISLSIQAHQKGWQGQAWHRALVLTPPAAPRIWEQMIGREARYGQRAPTIFVDVLESIDYHRTVIARVKTRTRATGKASGFRQRLQAATWI